MPREYLLFMSALNAANDSWVMYFDAPLTATNVSAPVDVRVVLTINGALVLVLGLLPGGLMALCADAVVRALAT